MCGMSDLRAQIYYAISVQIASALLQTGFEAKTELKAECGLSGFVILDFIVNMV